jgi:hypothetical protein
MNCIYMGASALDAIEASPQLEPRKDKLTKEYLTLSEHYERENDGLDDAENICLAWSLSQVKCRCG